MIKEHDVVVLTAALPEEALEPGDVGTVVHVYKDGQAFEVEFMTLDGETVAVATVEASQVRPVSERDITHAHEMAARCRFDATASVWMPLSAIHGTCLTGS